MTDRQFEQFRRRTEAAKTLVDYDHAYDLIKRGIDRIWWTGLDYMVYDLVIRACENYLANNPSWPCMVTRDEWDNSPLSCNSEATGWSCKLPCETRHAGEVAALLGLALCMRGLTDYALDLGDERWIDAFDRIAPEFYEALRCNAGGMWV